jgi:hypothetical protein
MPKNQFEKCERNEEGVCEMELPTPYVRLNKETFFSADLNPEEQTLQITQKNPLTGKPCTIWLFLDEFDEIDKSLTKMMRAREEEEAEENRNKPKDFGTLADEAYHRHVDSLSEERR